MAKFNEIIHKNKLVLIDFSAAWCGPCQTMAPILKEVKEHYGERLSIIKIDVDRNSALAANFKIQGVPTLILYRSADQVWRQSGLITRSQLVTIIDRYAV